jgi:DNA polymerase-1
VAAVSVREIALNDDIFRDMARAYPVINPIRELRATLGGMRLEQLTVGSDGRNRALLSAYRAKTGRNQPSTAKFVFGPAVWVRHFIQPDPQWGIAYVDWEQQEFGIAAALSADPAMCAAYQSGDPYLAFAQQAGAIPPNGTRTTHGAIRDAFKACALAVLYGMGADSLAMRLGRSPTAARDLLRLHRQAYPGFWAWSNRAVDYAMIHNVIFTVFGWTLHLGPGADPKQRTANPRSLRNSPAQANGAEMLRLACCLATERGVRICAPVHDAVLIEAPVHEIDQAVALTQAAMAEASAAVLDGFQLRSEAKVFRFPAHYEDPRGVAMWSTVWAIIGEHLGRPLPQIISR